jgi:chromosome segregation ATPase
MQSIESKPINLKEVKETPGKTARKSLFTGVLKQYFFLLVIVTIIAAIVFGVFMMWEQKRFYRVEASSFLSYHHEQHAGLLSPMSIHEVLQIIRSDAVKQQAGDIVAIPQDKQKHLKDALVINFDSASGLDNLLKVSVKWDDPDQARQLADGYMQAAILTYVNFRSKYLHEIIAEQLKMKSEYEQERATLEGKLNQLAQSVHSESVKKELDVLRMHEKQLADELFDFQKQRSLTNIQIEDIKKTIPDKYDYSKLKIASQNPDIWVLLQKRNEMLENYEIQKVLGPETERQVKEAQIRYRLAVDALNKILENLNLMEDEVASLNPVIMKRVEELESLQATMARQDKYIEDLQYRLAQKQKEISAISGLMPQEEKLLNQYKTTLARLDKIDTEIMNMNSLATTLKKALLPLNIINMHRIKSFSLPNYTYLMSGLVIITLSVSFFIYTNTHGKQHARPAPTSTKR